MWRWLRRKSQARGMRALYSCRTRRACQLEVPKWHSHLGRIAFRTAMDENAEREGIRLHTECAHSLPDAQRLIVVPCHVTCPQQRVERLRVRLYAFLLHVRKHLHTLNHGSIRSRPFGRVSKAGSAFRPPQPASEMDACPLSVSPPKTTPPINRAAAYYRAAADDGCRSCA